MYGQSHDEIVSLFEGVYENARSWRSYDCLVSQEILDAAPESVGLSEQTLTRFICDRDKNRFVVVAKRNTERWESGSDQRKKSEDISCLVATDDIVVHRRLPSRLNEAKKERCDDLLAYYEFIDLRKLFLAESVQLSHDPTDSEDSFEQLKDQFPKSGIVGKVQDSGDDLLVTLRPQPKPGTTDAPEVMNSLVFSKSTMLPTLSRGTVFLKSGELMEFRQETRWKSLSNCFVPVTAFLKQPLFFESKSGGTGVYHRETTIRVHWFSVNEPLDPTRFDRKICSAPQVIRDLVDPVKSNATDLIDPPAEIQRGRKK